MCIYFSTSKKLLWLNVAMFVSRDILVDEDYQFPRWDISKLGNLNVDNLSFRYVIIF